MDKILKVKIGYNRYPNEDEERLTVRVFRQVERQWALEWLFLTCPQAPKRLEETYAVPS